MQVGNRNKKASALGQATASCFCRLAFIANRSRLLPFAALSYGNKGNDMIFSRDSTAEMIDGGIGADSVQGDTGIDHFLSAETVLQ
jgi:hypothetical protein